MYTRAILRSPGPDAAEGLTTADLGRPDPDRLVGQHAAYGQTLAGLGLELEILPPLAGHPDAYFVEDAALVFPETGVVTRPGAPARRGEEAAMAPVLARHRHLARIEAPGTLDGGDVLVIGKAVFIGLSGRTNPEGATQLRRILEPFGYRCRTVAVGEGLHFKSSVTWVGGNTLLMTEAFCDRPEFEGFERIQVLPGEEYAANTLWINGTLLTPMGFPDTLAKLQALGLPVVEIDTSEARKMDGGLTCMSVRF